MDVFLLLVLLKQNNLLQMTLIVGLGNPGPKYSTHRHNIGFQIIDHLLISDKGFEELSKKNFKGEVYKKNNIILLKPSTFMNLSGESVVLVKNYFDCDKILVIHDELEHPFGSIRFKHGGGHGGHNGLKSIDMHISPSYDRLRFGINKPENKDDITQHVLGNFNMDEKLQINELIHHCCKAIFFWNENGLSLTSSHFTKALKK